MAGYISLFFDDSSIPFPSTTLEEAKGQIFSNYRKVFKTFNPKNKRDLQTMLTNEILKEMESQLQQGNIQGESGKSNPIKYWDVSVGAAMGVLDKNVSMLDKINMTLKQISNIQITLSNAITAGRGIINQNLIEQMEQDIIILENIAAKFNGGMSEDSFRSAFFGALRGAIAKAQGSIHESAAALASVSAKQKAEKILREKNKEYKVIIESTGGKLIEDSQLLDNTKELNSINNPKNDMIIAVKDGDGNIVWSTGLSLKSTSSVTPTQVKIMEQSLSTLLNKVFTEENYLNWAGALGYGDWAGTRKGIGVLAKERGVSTSNHVLVQEWKKVVLSAIYSQVIEMFAGSGGDIFNNAQYLIINATPIPMREIFEKLESIQNPNKLDSIKGLTISGKEAALNRTSFAQKNVNAFVRTDESNKNEARIERSSKAWTDIMSELKSKKIRISLNYASLYGGATR